MLVPRAFATQAARKAVSPEDRYEKSAIGRARRKQTDGWRGFGWRPESFHKAQAQQNAPTTVRSERDASRTLKPARNMVHIDEQSQPHESEKNIESTTRSDNQRSTPVAVPSRPPLHRTVSRSPIGEADGHSGHAQARRERPRRDPRLPASVASVLDSTSIPKRNSFPRPRSTPTQTPARMSTQQLMDEWKKDGDLSGSSLSGSPNLGLLLSPPEEDSNLARNESSESFDVYSRSSSSDSVPTMPFLDLDETSDLSSSLPSPPSLNTQRKSRSKLQSQRHQLVQDLEHPLSPPKDDEMDEYLFPVSKARTRSISSSESSQSTAFRPSTRTRKVSSFKSNLTASLSNLRDSIRTSLSNFAGPSPYVLPEDHLSRGFFGPSALPIRSEMRPLPFDGPPTPQMRRYLNPSSYHVPSPAYDFHLHGHGRSLRRLDFEVATAMSPAVADEPLPTFMDPEFMIPLQTYERPRASKGVPNLRKSTRTSTNPSSITEAGRALVVDGESHLPQYRRELRENGEFLRVCILEMNMRRAGKLNDGPGKARLWLPPRSENESRKEQRQELATRRDVPKRWIAISAPS